MERIGRKEPGSRLEGDVKAREAVDVERIGPASGEARVREGERSAADAGGVAVGAAPPADADPDSEQPVNPESSIRAAALEARLADPPATERPPAPAKGSPEASAASAATETLRTIFAERDAAPRTTSALDRAAAAERAVEGLGDAERRKVLADLRAEGGPAAVAELARTLLPAGAHSEAVRAFVRDLGEPVDKEGGTYLSELLADVRGHAGLTESISTLLDAAPTGRSGPSRETALREVLHDLVTGAGSDPAARESLAGILEAEAEGSFSLDRRDATVDRLERNIRDTTLVALQRHEERLIDDFRAGLAEARIESRMGLGDRARERIDDAFLALDEGLLQHPRTGVDDFLSDVRFQSRIELGGDPDQPFDSDPGILDDLLRSRRDGIGATSYEDYEGRWERLRGDAEEQFDAANEALSIALATLRR